MSARSTSAKVARTAVLRSLAEEIGDWSAGSGPLYRQLRDGDRPSHRARRRGPRQSAAGRASARRSPLGEPGDGGRRVRPAHRRRVDRAPSGKRHVCDRPGDPRASGRARGVGAGRPSRRPQRRPERGGRPVHLGAARRRRPAPRRGDHSGPGRCRARHRLLPVGPGRPSSRRGRSARRLGPSHPARAGGHHHRGPAGDQHRGGLLGATRRRGRRRRPDLPRRSLRLHRRRRGAGRRARRRRWRAARPAAHGARRSPRARLPPDGAPQPNGRDPGRGSAGVRRHAPGRRPRPVGGGHRARRAGVVTVATADRGPRPRPTDRRRRLAQQAPLGWPAPRLRASARTRGSALRG